MPEEVKYWAYEVIRADSEVRKAFETALMTSSEVEEWEQKEKEQKQKQKEKEAEEEEADGREALCYLACCPIVAPLLLIAAPGFCWMSVGASERDSCEPVAAILMLPFAIFRRFGQCFGCINSNNAVFAAPFEGKTRS